MKNVAVLTEDGEFALFFRPHPGGFDNSRVPHTREFAIQGGSGRNWNWLMHNTKESLKITELFDSCAD